MKNTARTKIHRQPNGKHDPPGSGCQGATTMGIVVDLLLSKGLLRLDQIEYAKRVREKLDSNRSILNVVRELKFISEDQIRQTVRANLSKVRIGELLVELDLISTADLEVGLGMQKQATNGKKLGEILVENRLIEEQTFIEVLSILLGFPFIEPEFAEIDRRIFKRAPVNFYKSNNLIPIRSEDDGVLIAYADPIGGSNIDETKKIFGKDVIPAIASKKSIHAAIEHIAPKALEARERSSGKQTTVDIVNDIILTAIHEEDVSDIHIEPMKDKLRVRYRRDGVLLVHNDYNKSIIPPLTSRIKVLCKADIAEKRRHQGGRFLFDCQGEKMDIRVSFYITVHGEKIVLRLLNRQTDLLKIDEVGMTSRMLKKFKENALDLPSGVIIITGPTGSGKTTTVYSCINYLNRPQTSIITAEDPVEYVIDGIAQCPINPEINLTYDETLRHIVRQDPDVIVIGEIRDSYSAEVAVQAALTGHKVLTTFHTEDSIGGLIRLLNMEIDAFLISSTVVCVVAQRLLRKVCPECSEPYQTTPGDLLRMGLTPESLEGAEFLMGRGCPKCRFTGYKGRIAAFEMLILNESVRDALIERKTSHQIRQISIMSSGLISLFEDGINKAASGLTSVDEVLRCLPKLHKSRPLAEIRRLSGEI